MSTFQRVMWCVVVAIVLLLGAGGFRPRAAGSAQVGYCVALDRLEAAQDLGFDYLEVPAQAVAALSADDYARLRDRVKALRTPVRAANSFLPATLKVTGPEADPPRQREYVRGCLDRLRDLGVRTVVFGSGGARRVPDGFPREEAVKQLVAFGRLAAEEASRRGITIVLEPLRQQESNIVNSVGEGLPIVRAVDHPAFRILVDFYHLSEEKEDPSILREAGSLLGHVHVANPAGRVFPKQAGEAAYGPFVSALQAIPYRGGVSIEARTEDLAADAPASIAFLRQLLDAPTAGAGVAPRSTGGSPPVLASRWPESTLPTVLVPRGEWRPMPTIDDRDRWERLDAPLRARLLKRGDDALAQPIPPLPATLYLQYARAGDRGRFEGPMFDRRDRLHALVLAECVENRGRFLDAIVDTAWAISEESSWVVPAHVGAQRAGSGLPDTAEPVVDLFAAQTAHSLAWTVYLVGDRLDRVSPLVRPRLAREVDTRVLAPYLARDDFGWMGFVPRPDERRPNNWNPWINSNVLAATLLLEASAERRAALIHKALRSLDRFLGPYPPDGSCDEGPAYWGRAGGSLFESLELLHSASAGRIDVFDDPVVANIGRFLYRAHISGDWYVNIGDSSARLDIDGSLVYRYGRAVGDPQLQALGAARATAENLDVDDRSLGRILFTVFGWEAMARDREAAAPLVRDAWLPDADMQLMAARDREGTPDGFYVAAWAGHNGQSHNHNDVGNFIVFADGDPVFVDVGAPTYTSATFSRRRYELWPMQSAFHNLPTVNGIMQADGRRSAARDVAYTVSDGAAELRMDIAPAYPAEAGVASWQRTVRLERGRAVSISDRFALAKPGADVRLNLMTPCDVDEHGPGALRLTCGRERARSRPVVLVRFDGQALGATVERVPVDDARLSRVWGDHLHRIVLSPHAPVQRGAWTITVARP
jgi:sugar phosphate isomerase/epimerase